MSMRSVILIVTLFFHFHCMMKSGWTNGEHASSLRTVRRKVRHRLRYQLEREHSYMECNSKESQVYVACPRNGWHFWAKAASRSALALPRRHSSERPCSVAWCWVKWAGTHVTLGQAQVGTIALRRARRMAKGSHRSGEAQLCTVARIRLSTRSGL